MGEERIVIPGGKGMLGSDVAAACRDYGFSVTALDLPDFDITNDKQLSEAIAGGDIVVNCAAYTDVDKAESQAQSAYKVNAEAAGHLGRVAKKMGIWVLHISTDFVFDGKSDRPYKETDVPDPINEYGKSKLAGEQLLVESGCRHCIMRIEWTYGKAGKNFVGKLLSAAAKRDRIKVVDDQVGSPTATTQVAEAICTLVCKKPEGLYHFASSGYVSRFEMAKFIFDKMKLPTGLEPCKSSDFAAAAARPLNSCFDCSRIEKLLEKPIESWQMPLERFLREL